MVQANMIVLQDENRKRIDELFLEAEGLVATIRQQQEETREQIEKTIAAGKEAYGNLAALKLIVYAVGLYQQAYREIKNN